MSVTIGGNTYPTFEDVEGADIYLAGDVARAALWALRSADTKARGLVSATRLLFALPWCPDMRPDPAGTVPEVVKEVCAELASDLLAKPKLFSNAGGNSNVKTAKAGSASVEFFAPVEGGPPLPGALWDRLVAAGLVCLTGEASDDGDGAGAYVSGAWTGCRPLDGRFSDYERDDWLALDRD